MQTYSAPLRGVAPFRGVLVHTSEHVYWSVSDSGLLTVTVVGQPEVTFRAAGDIEMRVVRWLVASEGHQSGLKKRERENWQYSPKGRVYLQPP